MIFGMLPIALAKGSGAEVKNGMAWVIIGGLTSSLLLTLLIVPVIYLVAEEMKIKFNRYLGIKMKEKHPPVQEHAPESTITSGNIEKV
jgi:HAE1 family hydrophobic/amphiphilic exporter-1